MKTTPKRIKVASLIKLLGVEIDGKLNLGTTLGTNLGTTLGFKHRKTLVNIFVLSNFNYCL